MAVSFSLRYFVIIVLLVVAIISGIILTENISEYQKGSLNELPSPYENPPKVVVNPKSSQEGTVFHISARLPDINEIQGYTLNVQTEDFSSSVILYDDGKHFDSNPRDGVYAGYFESEGKPLGIYNITQRGNSLANFIVHEPNCEPINGNPKKENINFVIVPSGYDNYQEFKQDALNLLSGKDSISTIEPFRSNKDKFSFSVVPINEDPLECTVGCSGVPNAVCCSHRKVLDEASQCTHDEIFILVNSNEPCGSATSYAKICSKSSFSKLILVHELGHSFAGLADEYVYEDQYPGLNVGEVEAPNCSPEGCNKWSESEDGCFQGCTYSDLYRPAEKDSIMYTFHPGFNNVSENHIESLINNYVTYEENNKDQSYIINLKYDRGEIEVKNIFLKPIHSGKDLKDSQYRIQIGSNTGNEIYGSNFILPNVILPIFEELDGSITLDNFEFSLIAPFSTNARDLEITRNGEVIESASIQVFSNTCGNGICENSENHISCEIDCELDSDNFCQESLCDPDCESQLNCKLNQKILIWIIIGGIVAIASFVLFSSRKKI